MKIMIVCGGFFPAQKHGGPVISIDNFVNLLDNNKFYIVTSCHDWKSKEKLDGIVDGWNDYSTNCRVLYLENKEFTVNLYRKLIRKIKPDIIFTNCFFLAKMQIPILIAARLEGKKVLDAPRGAICKNALAISHSKKMLYIKLINMLINKNNMFYQSTSNEETYQIQRLLNAKPDCIFELPNIPSIPKDKSERLYSHDKLRLCFFSRICEKKNLLYAIEVLRKIKNDIEFHIYGTKEDSLYWDKCQSEIKALSSNIKVVYEGSYRHDQVFSLMKENDVFFLPTMSENYGHVIIEALLAGLPVIISDQTPWNDVEENHCGWSYSLSDREAFIKTITMLSSIDEKALNELKNNAHKYARKKIDLNSIKKKYNTMMKKISESK